MHSSKPHLEGAIVRACPCLLACVPTCLHEANSLAEHARHIVDQPKTSGSVDNLLGFMARATKYVKGSLFERLFTAIAGRARIEWGVVIKIRLIVKLPKYEKRFHQKISSSL